MRATLLATRFREAFRQEMTRAGEEVYSMRKMLMLSAFAVAVVTLLATAAISATGQATTTSATPAKTVVISTRKLPKLGTVLVNSKGRTLYMFVPDKQKKVTCVKSCAVIWPPVKLPKGAKPVAAGKAKSSLLGSDPSPTGGRVVTYNGWPLYGDLKAAFEAAWIANEFEAAYRVVDVERGYVARS